MVLNGTFLTVGLCLWTDRGAQFHEGLIVITWVDRIEEILSGSAKDFDCLSVAGEGLSVVKQSGEDRTTFPSTTAAG